MMIRGTEVGNNIIMVGFHCKYPFALKYSPKNSRACQNSSFFTHFLENF